MPPGDVKCTHLLRRVTLSVLATRAETSPFAVLNRAKVHALMVLNTFRVRENVETDLSVAEAEITFLHAVYRLQQTPGSRQLRLPGPFWPRQLRFRRARSAAPVRAKALLSLASRWNVLKF